MLSHNCDTSITVRETELPRIDPMSLHGKSRLEDGVLMMRRRTPTPILSLIFRCLKLLLIDCQDNEDADRGRDDGWPIRITHALRECLAEH